MDVMTQPVGYKNLDVDKVIARCQRGDQGAYREIYSRYARAMYNTCHRIVNNQSDAEDLLQEGFALAFRRIHSFDGRSTFGWWLKRIMVNTCISHVRKKKLDMEPLEANQDRMPEDHQTSNVPYNVEQIHTCIQQLPTGYRTVLSLYLLEGYDHREISEILNVAESTTRSQYVRARKKLQENLKALQS